jgi:hypothetical protein
VWCRSLSQQTVAKDAPFDYAISPRGAGSALFSDESDLGLYIDWPAASEDSAT